MSLILVARLIVIAVLGYSGLAKLGSTKVATAARDLGLSGGIASWVGRFLAPAEILVALMLFFGPTAYAASLAALALFVIFTALVASNLRQGRRPACACFGEAGSQAISNWTLVRNLAFVALSAIVVIGGPSRSQQGMIGELAEAVAAAGSSTVLALIMLFQIVILIGLWAKRDAPAASSAPTGQAAAPPSATHEDAGWPPGTLAPGFDLPSLDGKRVTLQHLLATNRNVLLLFTDPHCRPCSAMLPEIAQWQERHGDVLTVALVTKGSALENRAKAEEFGLVTVLLQGGSEVAAAYQAEGTPTAVVIDSKRRIASRVAAGAHSIRRLVEGWAERSRVDAPLSVMSPPPPKDPVRLLVGDPAPPFKLPALRGGEVDLSEFAGRLLVMIFWSPTCGFCREMAPALLAREPETTEESAQIVFVAAGTREANEAEGFASPVLLEASGALGRAYGVGGTPTAILVDAESRVGSGLATGRAEIDALLRRADAMARAARSIQT
jgi:peroxiredoxin